jgi:hypothetical protein
MSEAADQLQRSRALFRRLFDSRDAQAALLDLNGVIIETNSGWDAFGRTNGLRGNYSCIGKNYLDATERAAASGVAGAKEAYLGLLSVIHGQQPKFTPVYPCHSPTERRWYRLWIEPQMPAADAVVVVHYRCPDEAVARYGSASTFGTIEPTARGMLSRGMLSRSLFFGHGFPVAGACGKTMY